MVKTPNLALMSVENNLLDLAIEKGELVQFLGGFPGYYLQPLAADLPTEYTDAFFPIKMRIKDEPELGTRVVEAIVLLSQDPVYGWGAIDYLISLALLKQHQGIDLLSPELVTSVASGLRSNKEGFIALKRWEGKNHANGVWSFVQTSNRILSTKYNIIVLPEEL